MLTLLVVAGCSDDWTGLNEGPTMVVTPVSATMAVGDSTQLVATIVQVKDRRVVWVTSASTIAVVDPTGMVHGKSAGIATITATSVLDPNVKSAALVTVTAAP